MIKAKNNMVSVSIDVGADTAKAAYSFIDENGDYFYGLLLEEGDGLPSLAYYDEEKEDWIFDSRSINRCAEGSFRYLVKIKDLLNLFHTRAKDGLYDRNFFKDFYYPPKENETYLSAVENDRCFAAKQSPREVCGLFFRFCVERIEQEIKELFGNVKIRYVVVYPAHAKKAYIDELVGFVKAATSHKSVYILSAPRAVGVSAKEFDVVKKQKNVLLFNVGEEEISVVKIRFDEKNICIYSADGHNAPLPIGGRNVDIALTNHLFEKSEKISSFGASDGQSGERGGYYDQFRMQQGVKAGKKIFSNGLSYKRLGNSVTFSVYREMITTVNMKKEDFVECCESVFLKVWEYVESELVRPDNDDVEAIIFSGGAADSYGLDKYIAEKLHKSSFKKVKFLDFSPENEKTGYDDILCDSKDTVPIGAALFGIGKYAFSIITSYSFGTWTKAKNSRGGTCYLYNQFIPKGTEIEISGDAEFSVDILSSRAYTGEPCSKSSGSGRKEYYRHDGKLLIFNEYYKCNAGDHYTRWGNKIHYEPDNKEKNDYIILDHEPARKMRESAKDRVEFEGKGMVSGIEVAVDFEVIGYFLMVYEFPKGCAASQPETIKKIFFKEGFSIDSEGRATPVVKNVSAEEYAKNNYPDYQDLYQDVKIYLIPNGTDAMDINN